MRRLIAILLVILLLTSMVSAREGFVYPNTCESILYDIVHLAAHVQNAKTQQQTGSVNEETLNWLLSFLRDLERHTMYSLDKVMGEAKQVVWEDIQEALNNAESLGIAAVTAAVGNARKTLQPYAPTVAENLNEADRTVTVTTFSDVPQSHWAYGAIVKMARQGLFSGTSTPVNGVGTFSPNATMTRAQFITVVMRALFYDELQAMPAADTWYRNGYTLAEKKKIVGSNEIKRDDASLLTPINRQEMSMIMVRACSAMGEEMPRTLISVRQIKDSQDIGTAYIDFVKTAYTMGLLMGMDSQGSFNPRGYMTRAQGAIVLNRLLDKSSRGKA